MTGKLFIISAPSGAGKTSLVHALIPQLKALCPIKRLITYTSKTPRPGEKQGIDYHFISSEEFEEKAKKGFFLEWSTVYGTYYGSPSAVLKELKCGKSFLLIVDRVGAAQIVKKYTRSILIWVEVPTIEDLKNRLEQRGTDTPEQIKRRLAIAKAELEQESRENLYKYHVCNDIFEDSVRNLRKIVLKELNLKDLK